MLLILGLFLSIGFNVTCISADNFRNLSFSGFKTQCVSMQFFLSFKQGIVAI